MGKIIYHAADTRGHADHGWLNAHHSFSFAGYYDPERVHFGALRVLNDDIVAGGMGFGTHPHDNMEIITIPLEGALEHKDSMGHTGVIQPGEVQVMSAGTGIRHSEYNHYPDKNINLLQIWIFPNKKNVQPQYGQEKFDVNDRKNNWQLLVSPFETNDAGLKIHQNAWISRTELEKGGVITYHLHNDKNGVYVFVIDGMITTEDKKLNKRDALGISETTSVQMIADERSDVLILEVPMHV